MLKNIVLIGFMATGKSTVARCLHDRLGWTRVSTDEMVIKKDGRSITEIFQQSGEDFFRTLEREAVQEASESIDMIIDCGGGVVKNPDNIKDLKRQGVIFWLQATPEIILERTKKQSTRPLLLTSDPLAEIKKLLNERQEYYQVASDYVIDANGNDFHAMAQRIVELMQL